MCLAENAGEKNWVCIAGESGEKLYSMGWGEDGKIKFHEEGYKQKRQREDALYVRLASVWVNSYCQTAIFLNAVYSLKQGYYKVKHIWPS